jgi:hypothetical protein
MIAAAIISIIGFRVQDCQTLLSKNVKFCHTTLGVNRRLSLYLILQTLNLFRSAFLPTLLSVSVEIIWLVSTKGILATI